MIFNGGFHLLDLLNTFGGGVNLLLLAIFEIVALAYSYGIDRFVEDLNMMWAATCKMAGRDKVSSIKAGFWLIMWRYVTIVYLSFISILWIINYSARNSTEPEWAISLGWFFRLQR